MTRRLRVWAAVCEGLKINSSGTSSVIEIEGVQIKLSQAVAESLFLPPFMQPDPVSRPHLVTTVLGMEMVFVPGDECRFSIWGEGGKVVTLIAHEVQAVAIPETSAA